MNWQLVTIDRKTAEKTSVIEDRLTWFQALCAHQDARASGDYTDSILMIEEMK